MSVAAGVQALRDALRGEGGALAAALASAGPVGPERPDHAATAAAGPCAAGHADEIALAVRAVLEGARLHYAGSQAVPIGEPDLALLAGDRLYALGLARLAELGALDAIAELADVIALGAQAHAAGDPDLAEAAWELGAAAVGWGTSPEARAAKASAQAGAPGAAEALRAAGRALARPDDVSCRTQSSATTPPGAPGR